MQGRRLPDVPANNKHPWPQSPGDYYRDLTDGSWYGTTPNGLLCWLKNHHVEEHADGTISVLAGPWGSNSILTDNGTGNERWHGYIDRGIWQQC